MTFARSLWIWGTLTLLLLLGGVLHPALAADGTTVDFSPLAALLREYASVAIDALIGAALAFVLRFLHLSSSAKAVELADQLRGFLHGTVERGLDRALATVTSSISAVDMRNQVVASALAYVLANARDAVDRLGASPDDLRRLIEAKLGARGEELAFVRASP